MTVSNGWAGRVLRVDLTTKSIRKNPLLKDWAVKYIGGIGFGVRVLYDEVGSEVDAFSPENIIVIAQGPLSGTLAPSSGRCELITKSPLTRILGHSNLGGDFGPTLKWAGYDLMLIKGKSERPVYLWIEDDHVEIRDASQLWGQDVWAARNMLCDEHKVENTDRHYLGTIATILIGPGGENLSLASCVMGGRAHASGMGSIAAVLGSKNLKGVAIRGSKGVKVARPAEFLQLCEQLRQRLKEDPLYESMSKWGTMSSVGSAYSRSPAGRVRGGERFKAIEEVGFEPLVEKNLACSGCPIHCDHFLNVREGKYKGSQGEGVEGFVQAIALSFKTPSAPFLCQFNNLCNQLGLNVASVGAAIIWAMELWKDGIITKEDTDDIEVTEGNEDAILELTRKMAYREGFGGILADYPLRAAQKLGRGSELYASHNKGLQVWSAGAGVLNSLSYTLANNVATRGFDHLTGATSIYSPDFHEEWGITRELLTKLGQERYDDPKIFTEEWVANPRQAHVVYDQESICAMVDMTGLCKQPSRYWMCVAGINMLDLSELLTAATGQDFTTEDLVKAAERRFAMARAYNAREGIRRIDDYPFSFWWQLKYGKPHPLFDPQKLPTDLEGYNVVLDEYYRLRGCDLKTGIPTRATLERLGLKDIADDLARRGCE